MFLYSLRRRFHRFRRGALDVLPLRPHQIYPEGSKLRPEFLSTPTGQDFILKKQTPVASMGSCFAREIKLRLVDKDYNYVQTEHNAWSHHASCAWERVYASANASQILDYTDSGELHPERIYPYKGQYFDLWRNKITYQALEDAETDIRAHISASRAAIEQCELFILTVGQNELWQSKSSGHFYARRPPSPLVDSGEARLVQLSVEDNVRYLENFHGVLKKLNPRVRLLLTLSPVPSVATFHDENVVVQSLLNKSMLRVAISRFVQSRPDEVMYFPSYEIVQTWRGNPFVPDNVHVKPRVIDAIMRVFFKTYATG